MRRPNAAPSATTEPRVPSVRCAGPVTAFDCQTVAMRANDHPPPTVIVARRFRPGRERDGEHWLRRLIDAASAMPGHVESTMQPPDVQHPDEWVIVYRFASSEHLDEWLDSARRHELIAEGEELIDGDAREQVIALADEATTVTAVASFRIDPTGTAEFREWYRRLHDVLDRFDGFIRSELVEPVPGTQDDTAIIFSFTSRRALDRWLESSERRRILAEIDPLLQSDRTVNVIGGFAGWFSGSTSAAPKRWKQAALVLLALYPTAMVLGEVRSVLYPDLSDSLAVLVGNIIGVAILSWVLMPALTQRFDGWLRR
jgi:uncharacterized protein